MDLLSSHCVPCEGGIPPLSLQDAEKLREQTPGWTIQELTPMKISKTFAFDDFSQTMRFVNAVAQIAEKEDHHPDMHVSYGKIIVELWTHAVKGLSENDFIVAAKIDQINQ